MLKKPSIHELLIKAADSISGPTDNMRLLIKDKIEGFVIAHDRSPSMIHLTRRQLKELERSSSIPIIRNGSVTVFGIPISESNKFRVS